LTYFEIINALQKAIATIVTIHITVRMASVLMATEIFEAESGETLCSMMPTMIKLPKLPKPIIHGSSVIIKAFFDDFVIFLIKE